MPSTPLLRSVAGMSALAVLCVAPQLRAQDDSDDSPIVGLDPGPELAEQVRNAPESFDWEGFSRRVTVTGEGSLELTVAAVFGMEWRLVALAVREGRVEETWSSAPFTDVLDDGRPIAELVPGLPERAESWFARGEWRPDGLSSGVPPGGTREVAEAFFDGAGDEWRAPRSLTSRIVRESGAAALVLVVVPDERSLADDVRVEPLVVHLRPARMAGGAPSPGTPDEPSPAPGAAPATPSPSGVAAGTSGPSDFSGVWETSFGELRLHQFDGYLVGDYAGRGVILGRVRGDCVAGVFTNGGRNGIFRWTRSGSAGFRGRWAWHGEPLSGAWRGSRSSGSAGRLRNFSRDGSATRIIENDRKVWDGTYGSTHGTLRIRARDLFLVGDYADRGILAGMWDGDSFVGRFTNGGRTGWFDFPSLSRTGAFREGSWGWMEGGGGGSWSLEKRRGHAPTLTNMTEDVSCG